MKEKELNEYQKYEEMLKEFEDLVEIDKTDLHNEWSNQPVLYGEYAEALAKVSMARETVKSDLERLKATLYIAIKKEYVEKKEKITEAYLEALIISNEDYQKMENKFINISGMEKGFAACIKTLDQRKKALEGIVQLYVNEYFSIPREPKKESKFNKEKEKKTEETKSNQRKGLNRKNNN